MLHIKHDMIDPLNGLVFEEDGRTITWNNPLDYLRRTIVFADLFYFRGIFYKYAYYKYADFPTTSLLGQSDHVIMWTVRPRPDVPDTDTLKLSTHKMKIRKILRGFP